MAPRLNYLQAAKKKDASAEASALKKVVSEIAQIGGGEGLGEFQINEFFKKAFEEHTEDEVKASLTVGTSITTPGISELDLSYPQPWLFFRLATASIILFYGFVFCLQSIQQRKFASRIDHNWIYCGTNFHRLLVF